MLKSILVFVFFFQNLQLSAQFHNGCTAPTLRVEIFCTCCETIDGFVNVRFGKQPNRWLFIKTFIERKSFP